MFESLKNNMRARTLRKYGYKASTSLMPLTAVRTAAVVLDVEDPAFEPLKKQVLDWFKARGIKTELYFFDFRKIDKEEMLLTSMKTTFIRRELNWYGRPAVERVEAIVESRPFDLFISLVANSEFPIRFLASCLPAAFKVGISGYEGSPYDLVVSAPTPTQSFNIITNTLEKIQ